MEIKLHRVLIVSENSCILILNYLRHSEINWNFIVGESQGKRDFFVSYYPSGGNCGYLNLFYN